MLVSCYGSISNFTLLLNDVVICADDVDAG